VKFDYGGMAKQLREKDARLVDKGIEIIRRTVKLHGPRLVQEEIQGVSPRKPVDRGTYRRAFRFEDIPHGAMVYNFAPHAPIIELGRRPGARMPPLAEILAWVKRKKILPQGPVQMEHTVLAKGGRARSYRQQQRSWQDRQQEHIALQIARRIKARGLPARLIVTHASVALDRQIQAEFKAIDPGS